jgi:hypothetical protein
MPPESALRAGCFVMAQCAGGIAAKWVAAAWPTGNAPCQPRRMMKVSVQL